MNAGAAPAWFDAGAIVFMLAGAPHLLLTVAATACFTIAAGLSA